MYEVYFYKDFNEKTIYNCNFSNIEKSRFLSLLFFLYHTFIYYLPYTSQLIFIRTQYLLNYLRGYV